MDGPLQIRSENDAGAGADFDAHDHPVLAVMTIRFWLRPRQGAGPAGQPDSDRERLRHLTQDLLTVRQGKLFSQNGDFLVFRFESVTTALSAAKQLQSALQGFRNQPSAPAVGAAIALSGDLPASSGDGGASAQRGRLFEGLLELAKPAQVLITHGLYEDLQGLPGIEFRSFPARSGIYEYLWTRDEDLAALQSMNDFNATVVQPIAVAETALPQSISHFGMRHKFPKPDYLKRKLPFAKTEDATTAPLTTSKSPWLRLREVPRRHQIQIAAAVGGVLLLAAILTVYLSHGNSPQAPPVRNLASSPVSGVPSQTPAPVSVEPPQAIAPTPAPRPAEKSAPVARKAPKPLLAANKPEKDSKEHPDKMVDATANCTIAGHVPDYLRMAEKNRSHGDYKDAERQYREVLNCEPGNEQARDGLSKAQRAEQEHFGPSAQ